MKDIPLSACPFCGGEAKLVTLWLVLKKDGTQGITMLDEGIPIRCVRCQVCDARSKSLPAQDAASAWNKRSTLCA
jgi:hypothetical protein